MRKLMETSILDEDGEVVKIKTAYGAKVVARRRRAGKIARGSRRMNQRRLAIVRRQRQKRRDTRLAAA